MSRLARQATVRGDRKRSAAVALAMLVALGVVALAPPSGAQSQVVGVELALTMPEDLGEISEEPVLVEGQLVVTLEAGAPETLEILLETMSDFAWTATVEPARVEIPWAPGMATEHVIPFVLNVTANPFHLSHGESGEIVLGATAYGGSFYEYAEASSNVTATMAWIPALRPGFGNSNLTVIENDSPLRERVLLHNDGNADVLLSFAFESVPTGCALTPHDDGPTFAYEGSGFVSLDFDVACGTNATGGEASYVVRQRLASDPLREGPTHRGAFDVQVLVVVESDCSGVFSRSCGTTYGTREDAEAHRLAAARAAAEAAAAEAERAAAEPAPAATADDAPRETPAPAFFAVAALVAAAFARRARRRA